MRIDRAIKYLLEVQKEIGNAEVVFLSDDGRGFLDVHYFDVIAPSKIMDEFQDGEPVDVCALTFKSLADELVGVMTTKQGEAYDA